MPASFALCQFEKVWKFSQTWMMRLCFWSKKFSDWPPSVRTWIFLILGNLNKILKQVAYSLTGEGWNDSASAVSLRGLDAAVYYRAKGVLNCGHALVRNLILASLRHWLREFRVDGFCFLHAETLALGEFSDSSIIILTHLNLLPILKISGSRSLKLQGWTCTMLRVWLSFFRFEVDCE